VFAILATSPGSLSWISGRAIAMDGRQSSVGKRQKASDIAVALIAHRAGVQLAVDSTLATPVATRPLVLGADFVVHSLTKYLNGHGDALGGVVIGRRRSLADLRRSSLIHLGGALSPFNAWLIRRGLRTLELRMRACAESAMKVATLLETHARIKASHLSGTTVTSTI
jgi:cystathionine gamma-synthase